MSLWAWARSYRTPHYTLILHYSTTIALISHKALAERNTANCCQQYERVCLFLKNEWMNALRYKRVSHSLPGRGAHTHIALISHSECNMTMSVSEALWVWCTMVVVQLQHERGECDMNTLIILRSALWVHYERVNFKCDMSPWALIPICRNDRHNTPVGKWKVQTWQV